MTHETFRELLPLYVIGALDGDELLQFERYVAENRERSEPEIAELQSVADQITLAAPPATPSHAVFHRVMAAIEEEQVEGPVRTRTRVEREREGFDVGALIFRWIPWTAGAVMCVLVAIMTGQMRVLTDQLRTMTERGNDLSGQNTTLQSRLNHLQTQLDAQAQEFRGQSEELHAKNDKQGRDIEELQVLNAQLATDKAELVRATDQLREQLQQQKLLVASLDKKVSEQDAWLDVFREPAIRVAQMTDPKKEGPAVAKVYWHDVKKTGYVVASNLTPVIKGREKCLELWAICGNEPPVAAGIGWTDEAGHGVMEIKLAKEIACADKFAVTIEPAGGGPVPTGPMILFGQ